jgi:glutamate racemase
MNADQPIGMFDSGLGGLSVYREVRGLMPGEDVIYYADSAYCPYGLRSPEEIRARSLLISEMLLARGAKVIVVACNTASAMAITHLREALPGVAFVGLEPAVKPAVKLSGSGKVGVLATPRTVAGERLRWLIETHGGGVEVRTVAAPGLVELVEDGLLRGEPVREALQPLLDPMLEVGVDVVVLGCTHYPFLREEIQAYVGPDVAVIDSGLAIARRTRHVLGEPALLRAREHGGTFQLMTSGDANHVRTVAEALIAEPIAPITVGV